MKLSTKLFLIFLAVTATMLLMAMGLARYSFQQGFLEFVGSMEKARLQKIAQELVVEYQNNNFQWQWLSEQGLNTVSRPLPKHLAENLSRPQRANEGSRPPRHPPPHESLTPPNEDNRGQGPATAVFDQKGILLTGNDLTDSKENMFRFELSYNGEKIGEIRSWPNINGSSEITASFARQQFSNSIVIALFCLLVAGCISWLLSRKLLTPIHQLRQSIAGLNAGKYGKKIATSRTDELGELMTYVDNLSQTLDKNRSAKNRMFADISHELRTPLTVLAGEIELLKAGIRPFNQQNLLSIEQESNRLRHLVDDLYQLSLSDLGGLKYTFAPCDIASCLVKSITSVEQLALSQNIQISTEIVEPLSATIDENRIEQLFANLLMNAISYTDSPGHIKVMLATSKNSVFITIEDSAPGVSTDEYAKLFAPLYRVDAARSRRTNGAGLGLAISKNIVEAHQGQLVASPSSLGGLCMTITLPITRGA